MNSPVCNHRCYRDLARRVASMDKLIRVLECGFGRAFSRDLKRYWGTLTIDALVDAYATMAADRPVKTPVATNAPSILLDIISIQCVIARKIRAGEDF